MRKTATLLLVICLLLAVMPGLAEGDTRRSVSYPGQDLTLVIPAGCKSFYRDNIGMSINFNEENNTGYCRVRLLSTDASFSGKEYLENDLMDELKAWYTGSSFDYLKDVTPVSTFTVAGREMLGRICSTTLVQPSTTWVLLDQWHGQVIRYDAYFADSNPDDVLLLLSNIVRSVNDHALAPKATRLQLNGIDCPQQQFSFSSLSGAPWKFDASNGVTVYTRKADVIPYIMVYQSNDLIVEAYEFLEEQYTPHMKEQYGQDLLYAYEFEHFLIGGKSLPVGWYEYTVQNRRVIMVRVMDSTGSRTVIYTAKFIQGEGADTMAALDAAVRTFRSTAR